jgi:5-hydroxyisourate hydrolase/2-oxo-4-hydroxy-4-carboxy-5-ureidoimidazoline decarboxylase
MKLKEFNLLSKESTYNTLELCCVSPTWINKMILCKPFKSANEVIEKAVEIWFNVCKPKDYLDAFTGHPKIGDVDSLQQKFATSKEWAGKEQASVAHANQQIIQELFHYNQLYEKKFGFIFIVSASGKSAEEMLQLLKIRYENDPVTELSIAMMEQQKITTIRLAKLLFELQDSAEHKSHITTHVLDTSTGKPGKGMLIALKSIVNKQWQTVALGITNADGRISDLLPPGKKLLPGKYKMVFDTEKYFELNGQTGFYPEIKIAFKITDNNHYHIPLLISPFGFSTYRGS